MHELNLPVQLLQNPRVASVKPWLCVVIFPLQYVCWGKLLHDFQSSPTPEIFNKTTLRNELSGILPKPMITIAGRMTKLRHFYQFWTWRMKNSIGNMATLMSCLSIISYSYTLGLKYNCAYCKNIVTTICKKKCHPTKVHVTLKYH